MAAIWILLYVMLFTPWEGGGCDHTYYYAYLSSALFDGNLDVSNDFWLSNNGYGTIRNELFRPGPLGIFVDRFPIGPALLWAPFAAPVKAAGDLANLLSINASWPTNRYAQPFCMSISLGTVCYGFLALVLMYQTCRFRYHPRTSLLAALGIALGSPLIAYTFDNNAMSHAQSAFCASLLVFLCFRYRRFNSLSGYILIAAALAVTSLVRWQDATLGLIPAAFWLRAAWKGSFRTCKAATTLRLAAAALTFCIMVSIQLVYWKAYYGTWLTMPQGEGYMQWKSPQIAKLLFSGWHGLYYWIPILALATIGFVFVAIRTRMSIIPSSMLAVCAIAIYVNASTWDWFGNASFGARRFCSILPIFALGLAEFFSRFRGRWRLIPPAIVLITAVANVILFVAYTRRMFDPFFLTELRELSKYHTYFWQWLPTVALQSQAAARLLIQQDILGALAILLPGLLLIWGLLAFLKANGFRLLEKLAIPLILLLCMAIAAADYTLLTSPSHATPQDAEFAQLITYPNKVPMPERVAAAQKLVHDGYPNPAARFFITENADSTATLADNLAAVRAISPRLYGEWVGALPAANFSASQREEAEKLRQPNDIYVPVVLVNKAWRAGMQQQFSRERRFLEYGFRYNPFETGILDRLITSYDKKPATQPLARELREFRRTFLEVKSHNFFRHVEEFPGRENSFFASYFSGPIHELINLYQAEKLPRLALKILTRLDKLSLTDSSDREKIKQLSASTN